LTTLKQKLFKNLIIIMVSNETKTLLDLILNESNKIPNIEGNTPLILKAISNSKLDNFNKEKENLEDAVCSLVKHFAVFNQTHFAELDSYISVSKFNMQKILNSFSVFVKKVEIDEDIYLKGCVLRFIQSFNKSLFQLDYIKKRFSELKLNDPWLYAELLMTNNWSEGVNQITDILKINNDTSYLFALITNWMSVGGNENNLSNAFNTWVQYFSEDDKELLKEFCKQYSFTVKIDKAPQYQAADLQNIILNSQGFTNFKTAKSCKNFESIPS